MEHFIFVQIFLILHTINGISAVPARQNRIPVEIQGHYIYPGETEGQNEVDLTETEVTLVEGAKIISSVQIGSVLAIELKLSSRNSYHQCLVIRSLSVNVILMSWGDKIKKVGNMKMCDNWREIEKNDPKIWLKQPGWKLVSGPQNCPTELFAQDWNIQSYKEGVTDAYGEVKWVKGWGGQGQSQLNECLAEEKCGDPSSIQIEIKRMSHEFTTFTSFMVSDGEIMAWNDGTVVRSEETDRYVCYLLETTNGTLKMIQGKPYYGCEELLKGGNTARFVNAKSDPNPVDDSASTNPFTIPKEIHLLQGSYLKFITVTRSPLLEGNPVRVLHGGDGTFHLHDEQGREFESFQWIKTEFTDKVRRRVRGVARSQRACRVSHHCVFASEYGDDGGMGVVAVSHGRDDNDPCRGFENEISVGKDLLFGIVHHPDYVVSQNDVDLISSKLTFRGTCSTTTEDTSSSSEDRVEIDINSRDEKVGKRQLLEEIEFHNRAFMQKVREAFSQSEEL